MTPDFLILPHQRLAYQRQSGSSTKPGVVFLGGYASDMTGTKVSFLAERCAEEGCSYLRFDYRGHGQSDGDFKLGTIGAWLEDTLNVFEQLTKGPQVIVGSSMGGWLGLLLCLQRPERIKAFVGIAAAPDFTEELMWQRLTPDQRQKLEQEGVIYDEKAPPDHRIPLTMKLVEEGRHHLLLHTVINIHCPIRLLQGLSDTEVPWQYALRITRNVVSQDTRIHYIKKGDHRLSQPDDLHLLWQTLVPFLS